MICYICKQDKKAGKVEEGVFICTECDEEIILEYVTRYKAIMERDSTILRISKLVLKKTPVWYVVESVEGDWRSLIHVGQCIKECAIIGWPTPEEAVRRLLERKRDDLERAKDLVARYSDQIKTIEKWLLSHAEDLDNA